MCCQTFIHYSWVVAVMTLSVTATQYSCRDENDALVDWFVIYKIPKLKSDPNPLVENGVAYTYITSKSEGDWVLSNKSINSTDSMPGRTLKNLYDQSNSQDLLYLLYNDQPPNGNTTFDGGHTKGVVLTDQSSGLWLVHSVPHYPPIPSANYSYPKSGEVNGQSFLCITLNPQHMELVGRQLMYNYPNIFANATPAGLTAQYPILSKAAQGVDVHTPPWYHTASIVTFGGTTFQAFAKAPDFNKDLYSDWLVTALQANLLVETWTHSQGRLNSSCQKPFRVENIDSVSVLKKAFSSHKDHSKWAVSESANAPWVCIGDINRDESQFKRGGGTVCLKDKLLWQAYFKSVSSVESCPRPSVVVT